MPSEQRIALLVALVESERSILEDPRFGPAAARIIRDAEDELADLRAPSQALFATPGVRPQPVG